MTDVLEARIETLAGRIDNPYSSIDGTLITDLIEMGRIEHPNAVDFLMGDGSMDHFFRRDMDEYKAILFSFMNYLRRGKLGEDVLRKIVNKLVEISQADIAKYGEFRQACARNLIKTLKREGNPYVYYPLVFDD